MSWNHIVTATAAPDDPITDRTTRPRGPMGRRRLDDELSGSMKKYLLPLIFFALLIGAQSLMFTAGSFSGSWLRGSILDTNVFYIVLQTITLAFGRFLQLWWGPIVLTTIICAAARCSARYNSALQPDAGTHFFSTFCASVFAVAYIHVSQANNLVQSLAIAQLGSAGFSNAAFANIFEHLIPASIFAALARNELLAIDTGAAFLGAATAALYPRSCLLMNYSETIRVIVTKIFMYGLCISPIFSFFAGVTLSAKSAL